ncbi:DAZ associated protein 2 (dazap2) [Halocaridina rubra]|uniref:DAZ-associated protein 2 n=1 Tax=Halocaridina rubra TaxID=373956 RepID=A0AAN8XFS8_HALRR
MSDKKGLPPTSPYAAAPPGVTYAQITAAAPPSYMESLSHPVIASPTGAPPQYPAQYTAASAAAAASAQQQLQMNMAAAQQAQKVAYAQQQAYSQQAAAGMYLQQQAAYAQIPGYYGIPASATGIQPGQNVLVLNGYDAGARFDGVAQPSIPPPPPGIAPNAAQLAASAGAQVSISQKKGSFLGGGSGGGYTFW